MKYVMYGSPKCTYCHSAKDLFEQKGIEYEYRDISADPVAKEFLLDLGIRTVPQILLEDDIGEGIGRYSLIGGYDALCKHLRD